MMSQARDLSFTDWHSPVMPLLRAAMYRLDPGPQGMLALLLALYWGAVFLLAGAAAQIERHVAPAMLIMGFMPFTINFAGTLWADVRPRRAGWPALHWSFPPKFAGSQCRSFARLRPGHCS